MIYCLYLSEKVILQITIGPTHPQDMCIKKTIGSQLFNSLPAKLFNCNFHPLEVVSR